MSQTHFWVAGKTYFASSLEGHISTLQEGLSQADIIVTTGGTSMGVTDLLKPVIERHLNGTIHFGRVTVKPGKPTTFATIPVSQGTGLTVQKPIFALPGNPASALVTFFVFVVPALRRLGGWPEKECQLPRVRVQVGVVSWKHFLYVNQLSRLTTTCHLTHVLNSTVL